MDSQISPIAGLGEPEAFLRVYIANRPPLSPYDQLDHLRVLESGEIADIVAKTGNHWRKIFNLYAKLAFFLDSLAAKSKVGQLPDNGQIGSGQNRRSQDSTWQNYRDHTLLQRGSGQALLFSAPVLSTHAVHIIMGKQHAQSLSVMTWFDDWEIINPDFSVSRQGRMVLCPYFDYRQLSNQKLDLLVQLVTSL
ncbi:hypothetical protein BTA51_19485 [Hahella sp. CCB-MM4]|nr:hypothetical protein BTA51_19485 [Hahella sp. CCB-MM4]